MPKVRAAAEQPSAVDLLLRATRARSSGVRAKYATRGLSAVGVDRTTQAMLLRQLYLAHMESERFEEARAVAEQMVDTGVMPDVARQDAARACLGQGVSEEALTHLRIASRVGPPSRRAFHLWTLGTTLYFLGRPREAAGVLARALRWGTTAKPLYAAQLALARHAAGDPPTDWAELRDALETAPCGQGYGQFVLGELAFQQGDHPAARRYLGGFVKKTRTGRVALEVALRAELEAAARMLRAIRGK